ncbi:ABC-2 transporter permease, partial [candidate division KSB1 bacterium]
MLDLIKKDFIAGALFFPAIVTFIPFLTTLMIFAMIDDFGGVIVGIFFFVVIALCMISSFLFIMIDSTQNADMVFASLPVRRSEIVLARYISSSLMSLFSYSVVLFTCFFAVHVFHQTDPFLDIILSFRGIAGVITYLLFMLAFMLPFILTFGVGKGMIVSISTVIGLQYCIPFIKSVLKAVSGSVEFDLSFINEAIKQAFIWL